MTTFENDPRVPMRPADHHQVAETVMKAVLSVAAVAGLSLLFFLGFLSFFWTMAS
ncbi:hypothetical protein ACT1U9_30940 [Streptomyces sp. BR1]|uniref:hypothetical protein n=1 Tax=Streptomyces sp. BR1 TaxID=1592323 RepID=UPI00402B7098